MAKKIQEPKLTVELIPKTCHYSKICIPRTCLFYQFVIFILKMFMNLKRWSKNEDQLLILNKECTNKELSTILNRTIPSIKSRKKKLSLTVNETWLDSEKSLLINNYQSESKDKLLNLIPNRTWSSILMMAKKLKLKRLDYYHDSLKNNNLNILLEDLPQSYYYIGLLMADGYFNGKGFILSQTIKSSSVIENFGKYINCTNITEYSGSGETLIIGEKTYGNAKKIITAQDINLVPEIMKKFSIVYERNKKTKTYYPPNLNIFEKMNDDLFLSYMIGFIDGDGYISKKIRNGNTIVITGHYNWEYVFTYWKKRLENITGIFLSNKSLKKENGCYRFRIYRKEIINLLFENIIKNNLLINSNKWGRI